MDTKGKKPLRPALGRGLAALISAPAVPVQAAQVAQDVTAQTAPAISVLPGGLDGEISSTSVTNTVRFVAVSTVKPNPKQPRTEFNESEIAELADSIRTLGVLQPVLVRPNSSAPGEYEIVAGERRWRASQRAGLTQIPVIVKELTDLATLEIALVENIQRSNLSPLEEARAYQRLADEFSLSQKEIAERVGKDRASVANYMRLLGLPPAVLDLLQMGQITMGHAKAILTVKEPNAQIGLAKKVVAENLSVRALEAIVSRVVVLDSGRKGKTKDEETPGGGYLRSADFPEVTDRLRAALGTKVLVRHHDSGRGRIEIEYFSEQELDRLVELLTGENRLLSNS
ncbi:MAG: ParB/RepB/Spo0J family partition protein [Proteobacteria bacterium]|nr:ParB/RepB/Spo0J family partition protein [Pseudomonadota bacterium]